jgi:uncharacterized protein
VRATDFDFAGGPSGSVSSTNDGTLVTEAPDAAGADELTVDYSVSAPSADTSHGGAGGADHRGFDERCLTYTTEPLDSLVELTGHPVVHLFVGSTAHDGDFMVYLEDVDEAGTSNFVTRKRLRASHRKVRPTSFYYFDAPWHSNSETDAEPIPPGEVVELAFDLLPTSYRFPAGHRIRVTVAASDADQILVDVVEPAPHITLHCDAHRRSRITLPVVTGGES